MCNLFLQVKKTEKEKVYLIVITLGVEDWSGNKEGQG